MRHINIPVFIPHLGCPHTCAFCNQRKISGVAEFDITGVKAEIDKVLSELEQSAEERHTEIAFFGGSFTGIPREQMTMLLSLVHPYLEDGRVDSLRCSTRPDYINDEIIDILKSYKMTTVELGIQSMSDTVLRLSERGHTAEQSEAACRLIKASGMRLVGQMMTGLPGSGRSDEIYTARKLCEMGVDAARIYPTMVFAGTGLGRMMAEGSYMPPDSEETTDRVADLLEIFDASSVPVIRIGLCSGEDLYSDTGIVAGGYEPAIGEMARSRVYLRRIISALPPHKTESGGAPRLRAHVRCPVGATSAVCGHRRANRIYLEKNCGVISLSVTEDPSLTGYALSVETENIADKPIKK